MTTPGNIDPSANPYGLYEGLDYEKFWIRHQRLTLDEHERSIVSDLLPKAGKRIIDVGCGYGRLAGCYQDRFQEVVLVDGSLSLLRQAFERTGGNATYVACDAYHLPFQPATFDTALMVRVFHHITDSKACLSEMNRILCKDGSLVFNYCNKRNVKRITLWLLGQTESNPFHREPDGMGSTFISHHPKSIKALLSDCRFSNIHDYGIGLVDQITELLRIKGNNIKSAKLLAPFLAQTMIAPWIICKASAEHNEPMTNTSSLTDLFQCPACQENVSKQDQGYYCHNCSRYYPISEGIFDFRMK